MSMITRIGFSTRTADIRLAQYESGVRTPKSDLTESIAYALNVSPMALNVPDIDTDLGLMHTLFALEDKKGEDIKVIDISEVSPISDYFVLASGSNRSQIQAMADSVEEKMHKAGFRLKQVEGYDSANWILMDFVDVVVHIFDRESREFYDLERIWKDGKLIEC